MRRKNCPWYITVAAVLDYQAIMGRRVERDGAGFDRAEEELMEWAERLVASDRKPTLLDSGAWHWRGPKPLRLIFIVVESPRLEGDKPQLVRVVPPHQNWRPPNTRR